MSKRIFHAALVCLEFVTLLAFTAGAQTITGIVTDPGGAVVPGVRVDAASPALIEQHRTVITDDSGRYRSASSRKRAAINFTAPCSRSTSAPAGRATTSRRRMLLSASLRPTKL